MLYDYDYLSFRILSINKYYHKNGSFHIKARPYSALSLKITGTSKFEIDRQSVVSEAGDIVFIPSGMPYNATYQNAESIVIHFSECNYDAVDDIKTGNGKIFFSEFEEMMNYWQKTHNVNGTKSMIYSILSRINDLQRSTEYDKAFDKGVSYIKKNFCNPNLDVKAICSEAFISESTLRRKFLKNYGISPKQYIMSLRIEKAIDMLLGGKCKIREISTSCGFSDEKYFSRVIKKKYGQAPAMFRQN